MTVARGCRVSDGILVTLLLASCVALTACSAGNQDQSSATRSDAGAQAAIASTAPTRTNNRTLTNDAWGFRIEAPPGWEVRHDFRSGYLANGAWKTFAPPDSQGKPILTLTVPGSNRISDAELRIGASRAAGEVRRCTTPPSAMRPGSVATQRINGVAFTIFEAGDAAMSHHLEVHAWRVLHDGTCYAVDLLVFGVNPQVYDPPATPPFSNAQAFAKMHAVLQTLRFTR
ncbi:MAG TPA: hypothetical protein VFW60_10270 [Rhodanobacteraceae bacterium]|nr:hypothetical protein [Rhodanobacteraceae bacterium]